MSWSLVPDRLVLVLRSVSINWFVLHDHCRNSLEANGDLQDSATWMIIDSNEVPGGLASTDVTAEGFVCYFPQARHFVRR